MTRQAPDPSSGADDQMAREIAQGPQAVASTLAEVELRGAELTRLVAGAQRVVVVATGASLAMSRAAAPAWRRARPEAMAIIVRQSTDAALGGLDGYTVEASDLVVAVSQSGTSPETLAAAEQARSTGAFVVAMTAHEESPLAGLATLVLPLGSGEERDASTKSALATLAALLAVAGTLPTDAVAIDRLHERLASVADDRSAVTPAVALLAPARRTWFVGFGTALGIAEAGALLWHEKVIRQATAATPSEFRHGLIEAINAEDAVVIIDTDAPHPRRALYLARLREELRAVGAAVIELSGDPDKGGAVIPRAAGVPIEATEPAAAALETTLRVQQLAHATAVRIGTFRDGFAVLRHTVLPATDVFGDWFSRSD